jgi:hypothetical protein
MTHPGPSRTIIVEPIERPEHAPVPVPEREPAPKPEREPDRVPEREPVPAR